MDQVYANASLTVIDASGGDARSGLPGVSIISRRIQKCVHIRNTAILELPCGEHELGSSKWITRGWTYQEGYFSARRLIFTASQVLFLCNSNYAEESVYRLLRLEQNNLKHIRTGRFRQLIPGFNSFDQMSMRPFLLIQLAEYSKRELTYQSDSLNAFRGVLNSYTMGSLRPIASTYHHIAWGLIVRNSISRLRVYLDWYHVAAVERRPEFPSWTWAGWSGPLTMEDYGITLFKYQNGPRLLSHFDWEISLRSNAHEAVDIWDLAAHFPRTSYADNLQRYQQSTYLKQLQITCLIVPICFQEAPPGEAQRKEGTDIYFENDAEPDSTWVGLDGLSQGKETDHTTFPRMNRPKDNVAVVQMYKSIQVAAASFLDRDLDTQDDMIGLLFSREDNIGSMAFGCLLARPLDEGLYERVGAIPHLMAYPSDGSRTFGFHLPPLTFLDETGRVLDRVKVPAMQRELPFDSVSERKTIILV